MSSILAAAAAKRLDFLDDRHGRRLDRAEDDVLAVEPVRLDRAQEELRAVGACATGRGTGTEVSAEARS